VAITCREVDFNTAPPRLSALNVSHWFLRQGFDDALPPLCEALDRDVKKPHENPSIGVLLCRDKDDEVVEYALSRNLSPALVAQYQLQLPDKKLLQSKLHELLVQEWGGEA
jgi:hypothetical protein